MKICFYVELSIAWLIKHILLQVSRCFLMNFGSDRKMLQQWSYGKRKKGFAACGDNGKQDGEKHL